MNEINTVDLKGFVGNAVNEVFDTMLSMEVEFSDADSQTTVDGNRIVGSVSFAGELMGSVCIQVPDVFARLMTAAMLGMELEEIEGEEEVNDVIGEVSNMIGGDLKSRFCDSGLPCELSIPSITSGSDFKVESRNYQQHFAVVEVFIK
ncbi:MAG: chemotaxis protein CheX [Deltaproteobacteria bacterium]|nr:chemotaxis protein CheX [Deltaproteobacteria bacterium]